MFEIRTALKYLIPRRRQLSVSLIALMSIAVISLVVWLVLLFLSVTEGIERNWLKKLTTLSAPLRITPTDHYYTSYYYQIDALSSASNYSAKSIAGKLHSEYSDPYSAEEDGELPSFFPKPEHDKQGRLIDPVKRVYALLGKMAQTRPELTFQDFELSGALMRLQLLRPGAALAGERQELGQSFITQASYLASLPSRCPNFSSILLPPTERDLNHQLFLAFHTTEYSREDAPALAQRAPREKVAERIANLLSHVQIQELKSKRPFWRLSPNAIVEKIELTATAHFRADKLTHISIPVSRKEAATGKLYRENGHLYFVAGSSEKILLSENVPLMVDSTLQFTARGLIPTSQIESLKDIQLQAGFQLQNQSFAQQVSLDQVDIAQARWQENAIPTLGVNAEQETGVLLAKSFRDSGVMVGDRGYLSYTSATASAIQEHRLPIFVSGFYDPGVLSVGSRCILVPSFVTRTINASSSSFNLDRMQSSGILVWFENIEEAERVKAELQLAFDQAEISPYWRVTTFREYDFAKDLLEQFQSDRYLFTLVGIIILVVACCNIISLLVLLVNDKKREIGVLQAMGASRTSIALIFGTCGVVMGMISAVIGTTVALFTLHNIDSIVSFISLVQGHSAFNTAFFGQSLPSMLSTKAVAFILIVTPLLSFFAGLVPALKACRLRPSEILRSE